VLKALGYRAVETEGFFWLDTGNFINLWYGFVKFGFGDNQLR